jgi:glycosyltransferase involved in cell wall biosynthesis
MIVSTTLTGNNRDLIADALRSVVAWVDFCLIIDTGITDDTLDVARSIAGEKLRVASFPWINDFSAARNFALQEARKLGAKWAVTLDSDERFNVHTSHELTLSEAINGQSDITVWLVEAFDGTYVKERILCLDREDISWVGPTHEALPWKANDKREVLGAVKVFEVPKSRQMLVEKFTRDIQILKNHIQAQPGDARWHFYLGVSYSGLNLNEEAVASFLDCAKLRGWAEEGAWASYLAGELLMDLNRPQEALDAAFLGLSRHSGVAELYWLAAYASYRLGNFENAVGWAFAAEGLGQYKGHGDEIHRIGFRRPAVLFEKPYDVLRFAFQNLGKPEQATKYEKLFQEASAARLAG